MAMLCGCDYTKGIVDVGITRAKQITTSFKTCSVMNTLKNFKQWWLLNNQLDNQQHLSISERKWLKLKLPESNINQIKSNLAL
ncbi:hypothetical protein GJ496_006300 [Pomphorhynchus laevis]|nr:hypothetical protein GJ496_006300 [Pomphorhynchus laevis]